MKNIVLLLCLVAGFNAHATNRHLVTCESKTDNGPLKNFSISFDTLDKNTFGKITKVNYIETNWDEETGVEHDLVTRENASFFYDSEKDAQVYFEFVDWAGTMITFAKDDQGGYALVEFLSDGPEMAGFYRCQKEFVSAWDALAIDIKMKSALNLTLTIDSDADCAEFDPYYVGDACVYDALISGDANKKVQVYLFDYESNGLKKGQVIQAHGFELDDSYNFISKNSYAIEL